MVKQSGGKFHFLKNEGNLACKSGSITLRRSIDLGTGADAFPHRHNSTWLQQMQMLLTTPGRMALHTLEHSAKSGQNSLQHEGN